MAISHTHIWLKVAIGKRFTPIVNRAEGKAVFYHKLAF